MINNLKNNKAITLIALVITIIVLLILAGVAISMLAGDNGILKQAANAKKKTEEESIIENIKLAETAARIDGYGNIDENELYTELDKTFGAGKYTTAGNLKNGLIITVGEYSYTINGIYINIPTGFKLASDSGSNIKEGIVIEDNNVNQYVWVPVPEYDGKNCTWGVDYSLVTSETDYTNIENALHEYTTYYRDGTNYVDQWNDGCGLSKEEYIKYKNTMLKSIYINGGFYVGRYEAGIETNRTNHTTVDDSTAITPSSKENLYPITYVYCREAQLLANKVETGELTSSLMFGVQYDCVLVYLEHYGWDSSIAQSTIRNYIKSDSLSWGNYADANFTLNRGKYALWGNLTDWKNYTEDLEGIVSNSKKIAKNPYTYKKGILCTTGASDKNSKCNIYDLTGNVREWTLERANREDIKLNCVLRGGLFGTYGSVSASYRGAFSNNNGTDYNNNNEGFRITLY